MKLCDGKAFAQLPHFEANPNQCEVGCSQPIFIAIEVASVEFVQLLINHKTDATAVEDFPTDEFNVQHEHVMRRRSSIEAAKGLPRILHILHEYIWLQ